jgi:hypothetical protein
MAPCTRSVARGACRKLCDQWTGHHPTGGRRRRTKTLQTGVTPPRYVYRAARV